MNNIYMDAYHLTRTYAGVYEGRPPVDDMIESAKHQLERIWGKDRKVLVFADAVDGKLPQWQHMIWLHGPESDPENHGSHLFVIWFTNDPIVTPTKEAISRIEKAGGWAAHAEDFQY